MSSRYAYDLEVFNNFVSSADNFNAVRLETSTLDTDAAVPLNIGTAVASEINVGQIGVDLNLFGNVSIAAYPNNLGNLTTDEITQLQNIDTTTISIDQWDYLGALDQGLTSLSDVTFNKLTLTNQGSNIPINTQLIVATDTILNTTQIVWSTTTTADVVINLPDTATLPNATTRAYRIVIFNKSNAYSIVLTSQGTDVVNGVSTLTLKKEQHCEIVNDTNAGWLTI